ncbi:MAG: coproporphyrinogen dehydrogenase HemZ [Eubacterium sp.]|nr:coproporphyrinogen dehydrogenase HemZ [Eubacterium sp.]MCH4047646.1 coproporphyrinogen dehydrogenase HemZ [Eubacterium sp.]MCH4078418.1 coproporphyrinogen dehydrogenase HemZ [Eubacterium sp.]MCH4109562.1 coproporphyrinogen dehydrogenase HemZ [Eubacterium sp.]MCI1306658.1 coproporphyrinogen dehydrogenase HemZ [Eubacterium sp.]
MPDTNEFTIKIKLYDVEKTALMRELIDEFLPPERYELIDPDSSDDDCLKINEAGSTDRDEIKRELFRKLSALTGKRPDWGILTGVRPVKLAGELLHQYGDPGKVRDIFLKEYFLTEEKADLITEMYQYQRESLGDPDPHSIGIYIGIPFCPTRCLYCSFASNQVPDEEVARYLPALLKEIRFTGEKMKQQEIHPESVYVGGGTPTTLTAEQMDQMLSEVERSWDLSSLKEFSVEAGRPDTITLEKLKVLKKHHVDRISINPQSMKQKTLDIIGRSHTPEEIREAFRMAASVGFDVVNADLIAGLPEEQPEDFAETLDEVLKLGANNITVHTLSVKRASRLKGIDQDYHYKVAGIVRQMLDHSRDVLRAEGFRPYYLYRQKHMAGYFENTGWSRPGTEGLYNTRIMDEHQSILALGAGGISKRYYPAMDKLVRVANVTNYQQYIDRIDEMCQRKADGFFTSDSMAEKDIKNLG